MTEDDGMTIPTPRPKRKRGRPHGSKDSYPRFRTAGKLPKPTILATVMPPLRDLIEIAELNGYNRIANKPTKATQLELDKCLTRVLAAVQQVTTSKEETI